MLPALALLALSPAPQAVHVVDDDGGPGVDFASLPAAVAAAAPGDVVLVKTGTYAGFDLDGKGLTVSADADAVVRLTSGFEVRNVPAGASASLRGLAVDLLVDDACRVANNAGWVGLEDCAFDGVDPATTAAVEGVLVVEASTAVLARCDVAGGATSGAGGGAGVAVSGGTLHLYASVVRGADGLGPLADGAGADGGDGVAADASFVLVSGGTVSGGDGGDGGPGPTGCGDGGDGGDGVSAAAGSTAWVQDVAAAGGAGGAGGAGCAPGAPGAATSGASALAGSAHALDVETPVRMGTLAHNVLAGEPGELAVLGIALAPDALFFPAWHGAFAVALPVTAVTLGLVPAGGELQVDVPVPLLAGVQGLQLFEQAVFVAPSGALFLSAPSFPLVLDPSF